MILRYNSVIEYLAAVQEISASNVLNRYSSSRSWDMGVTGSAAMELAANGDPSIVAEWEGQIEHVQEASSEAPRPLWTPSMLGPRVSVPAYLAGSPMCMRRRKRPENITRHVSVYVSTTSSGGITADDMMRRGAAILGYVQSIQAMGLAIDLYLVADMQGWSDASSHIKRASDELHDMTIDGDCIQVIRVESRPLDLSTAGFAMAHPAFARNVTYAHAASYGSYGSWSRTFHSTDAHNHPAAYARVMRAKLGCDETDIFVGPASLMDTLMSDPKAWIAARVAQACK